MLNLEVLKCHEGLITHWRHKYNKEKQYIIISLWLFGSWGGGGGGEASIIRLGPSWFTSTLSFILNYMSNIEVI